MKDKLAIIGIDSLDPYIILKYRNELPNLSKLIDESPTFISKSVFPVDTIPAWGSIYTGLSPGNHGLLYVYDVFDPKLSDLNKLDIKYIKGKTFWDHASQEGCRSLIMYPILMFPTWEINGSMVSKSPLENRIDWLRTERFVDFNPKLIKEKYKIPEKFNDLWGGYCGIKNFEKWIEIGKTALNEEKDVALNLYKNEQWDLFFVYFSLLDIIQHRLWRFFDEKDPIYSKNHLSMVILDFYKILDSYIGEFIEVFPDANYIIMSDHGHKSRPVKTVNVNEFLKRNGYLVPNENKKFLSSARKPILEIANKFNLEQWLIKIITQSKKLTKMSKSVYSSTGSIDLEKSKAYLSTFAGIKSYSHGGIEINRKLVRNDEYEKIRSELITILSELKSSDGDNLIKWAKKREFFYSGRLVEEIYPDIVFELRDDYGVGWEIHSDLFGKAYDHKVASGGHSEDAVFLIKNVNRNLCKKDINLMDVAPTILDILGIEWSKFGFDGESIYEPEKSKKT